MGKGRGCGPSKQGLGFRKKKAAAEEKDTATQVVGDGAEPTAPATASDLPQPSPTEPKAGETVAEAGIGEDVPPAAISKAEGGLIDSEGLPAEQKEVEESQILGENEKEGRKDVDLEEAEPEVKISASTSSAAVADEVGANGDDKVEEAHEAKESEINIQEAAAEQNEALSSATHVEDQVLATDSSKPSGSAKIFIVYYSMYGHVASVARKVKEGVDGVDGVEGILFQVPETLPDSVLAKMGAPPKLPEVPVIEAKDLTEADGFIFGFPTRFGMMCAQMKQFFDATGSLWQSQALAGKPAGIFFSTGTQGGGQETTALTAISQLTHHGMLFVPIGYTFPGTFDPQVHGGSPYGTGTYAGDGSRTPIDLELEMASHQGRITAIVVQKLKLGQSLLT